MTAPGFGFGSNTNKMSSTFPATPQFGFGATNQGGTGNFQFGSNTLGVPATQASGLSFNVSTTNPPGFGQTPASSAVSFGKPAATSAPTSFFSSAGAGPGLLGGATSGAAPSNPVQFSFAPNTTTPTLSLGGTGTANPGNFGFGGPATQPSTGLGGGFSFGASTTSAPAFSAASSIVGVATPFTPSNAATATTAASGLGTSLPSTSTLGSNLLFNTSAATSTPASLGLKFGASTGAPSFATSLLSTSTGTGTAAGPSFNLGASFGASTTAATSTAAAAATTPSLGLGGQPDTSSILQSKSGDSAAQKEPPPKEQLLPNEILQLVESFKNHIKQQKSNSSDMARCSIKDFKKVEGDIDSFNKTLIGFERDLQKNRKLVEKLKYDTAKALQHIEMAQRTQETPAGLQYENVAPTSYFSELVDQFEKEMAALKNQIESTDKYVRNFGQPATLTSQDLVTGMKRLHETFVALAGRLHSVHNQVETEKELYLNLRKQLLNDNTDPFENSKSLQSSVNKRAANVAPKVASGPTPFNNNNMMLTNAVIAVQTSKSPPGYPGIKLPTTASGFGFGSNTFGSTSAFGSTALGQSQLGGAALGSSFNQPSFSFNNPANNNFQLQKPPLGNKRGKQ